MKRIQFAVTCLLLLVAASTSLAKEPELVSARKIWDKAPHNAFTDLVRFKGAWYCVFREGKGHVSPDGALRVLTSADGDKWESAALIESPTSDLRDAKITVTPDNQLMLSGAEAIPTKPSKTHQSLTWFSADGRKWSEGYKVADENFWLWRTSWHGDSAYGVGYGTAGNQGTIRLYKTKDGKSYTTHVKSLLDGSYPNESSIIFLKDDTALCLLRRDGGSKTGLLGQSKPPYKDWTWKDLKVRIGGPIMLQIPDGRFVAAVRLYDGGARTSLCWIEPESGKLTEFLKLPSGGDTSYPGLVWHNDMLWISYYASHEGKTSIYMAKVKI